MELPTVTYMMECTSFPPSHILFMVYIFWLSCHLAIFLLLPVSQSEGSFFNRTCLLTTGLEYINKEVQGGGMPPRSQIASSLQPIANPDN